MANGIGNYTLKVTPEVLQTKAAELNALIENNKRLFEAIEQKINATSNYWQGDASDAYRNRYKSKKSDIETMFRRLKEHVTDLNAIAATYTKVENINVQMAESLPPDVIV